LIEEAAELADATTGSEVTAEAADLIYFALTAMARCGGRSPMSMLNWLVGAKGESSPWRRQRGSRSREVNDGLLRTIPPTGFRRAARLSTARPSRRLR